MSSDERENNFIYFSQYMAEKQRLNGQMENNRFQSTPVNSSSQQFIEAPAFSRTNISPDENVPDVSTTYDPINSSNQNTVVPTAFPTNSRFQNSPLSPTFQG